MSKENKNLVIKITMALINRNLHYCYRQDDEHHNIECYLGDYARLGLMMNDQEFSWYYLIKDKNDGHTIRDYALQTTGEYLEVIDRFWELAKYHEVLEN